VVWSRLEGVGIVYPSTGQIGQDDEDMPRKPKGALVLNGETLLSLYHSAQDPLPRTSEYLQAIVRGLLIRIERDRPKDAVLLRHTLQRLVLLEEQAGSLEGLLDLHHDGIQAFREAIQQEVNTILVELVRDTPRRQEHFMPVLRLQYTVLVNYLDEYQCPVHHIEKEERWIAEHRERIWTVLTHFTCYCTYLSTFEAMRLDDREWTRTVGKLASLLLAHLHQSTPLTIGKLLSHS
jgi:hypothetical protein